MYDFKKLKAASKNSLDSVTQRVTALSSKSYDDKDDGTFWKPTRDDAGNAYALIRFLPAPFGEDTPFIRYYDHAWKSPIGKWYIERSRTSLGPQEKDPCGELNSELWNEGENSPGRALVRGDDNNPGRKRRTHYIANILVIQDSGNPANNGKVFKYEFGPKIFDKLQEAMFPKFPTDKAFDPFNVLDGANFHLKVVTKAKRPNYDASAFATPGPLAEDEKFIVDTVNAAHSLQAELAEDKFKSYEDLQKRLDLVLGNRAQTQTQRVVQDVAAPRSEPTREATAAPWENEAPAEEGDTSFFENLARG